LLREKKKKSKQSNLNMGLVFRVFVGAFFSYIWMLNFQHVNSIEGLQSFDPYAILEIETDADNRAIKKQYRRLSLQLHPDKNPDNSCCAELYQADESLQRKPSLQSNFARCRF
jgi:preprotein translocase subunit Sec63